MHLNTRELTDTLVIVEQRDAAGQLTKESMPNHMVIFFLTSGFGDDYTYDASRENDDDDDDDENIAKGQHTKTNKRSKTELCFVKEAK